MTHTFPHPPTKLSQAKKESFGKWKRPASPPSTWQRRLRSFLIAWVIWLIRFFIDGFCARLQFVIELGLRMTIRRSVKVRHHHYGKGWREVVDIITTDQVALDDNSKPAIVYIHGGGWMIVSKDLMRPYVTYMARKGGYRVFNADYPLSPETKFPDALISVLRLLHWMRTKHNVDRVILMGDSAGANMCAMAGMLLHHPDFMAKLAAQIKMPQLATWQFPKIERNLFFYGLFDEESLHETRTAAAYVCREVLHMHRREEVFNGRCTPMDFINDYMDNSFPRTCIVTGTIDPLYPSNIKLYEILKNRGVKSELKIFHGQVHGFHSFFWSWERYDAQAFVLEHLQT